MSKSIHGLRYHPHYKRYKESALRYKNDVSKVIGRYVEIINETL